MKASLPNQLTAHSPILSITVSGTEGDYIRTLLRNSIAKTDALTPKGMRTTKKKLKNESDMMAIYALPPKPVCALIGSLYDQERASGSPVIRAVNDEVTRLLMITKQLGIQDTKRPPCVKEREMPIFLTVGKRGGFVEIAVVRGEELSSIGKTEDGMQCPGFGKFTVVSKVVNRITDSETVRRSITAARNKAQRVMEGRGICLVLNYGDNCDEIFTGELLDELKEKGTGGLKGSDRPKVYNSPEQAASIGAAFLTACGGEGRMKIGPSLYQRVQDVVSCGVGFRIVTKSGDYIKTVFDVDRSLPAKYEFEISAAEVAAMEDGKGALGEVDEQELSVYEGRKAIEKTIAAASGLEVSIVQKFGREEKAWKGVPVFGNSSGMLQTSALKPLVFSRGDEDVACPHATITFTMDTAGMCNSKLVRDEIAIEQHTKAEEKGNRIWYYVLAFFVLLFAAISYRSYKVTYVFNYNVKKLHRYYAHVNKTLNNLQEAQYIVYEYQDREDKLWEKLEKKYGEKVLEPHEYPDIVEEEEEEEEEATQEKEGKEDEKKEGETQGQGDGGKSKTEPEL